MNWKFPLVQLPKLLLWLHKGSKNKSDGETTTDAIFIVH